MSCSLIQLIYYEETLIPNITQWFFGFLTTGVIYSQTSYLVYWEEETGTSLEVKLSSSAIKASPRFKIKIQVVEPPVKALTYLLAPPPS